jgi:AcrR family transcriptional regulator
MARTSAAAAARDVRRDAFVDVALQLIQIKGYEQMSVQDLLDELGASRGAFYHYFDSKSALLDAVMERLLAAGMTIAERVVADPDRSAADKLTSVFSEIARWKNARRELMLALLEVWFSDDNAIVRDRLRRGMARRLTPVLTEIIRQGCRDGVFHAASPEGTARVLVGLLQGAQQTAGDLFLARQADAIPLETVERTFRSYAEAYERILGAAPGSLAIVDDETLHLWFD